MSHKEARNTIYFKAFNNDYRIGGIYHSLSLVALRALVIMQANVNSRGELLKGNGKGYNKSELEVLVGLDFRSLKRALEELATLKIIKGLENDGISMLNFVEDNVYRDADKKATRGRSILTEQMVQSNARSQRAENKIDKFIEGQNNATQNNMQ